jgi:AGZA family xanthine/uracil permease-like MFS transporter
MEDHKNFGLLDKIFNLSFYNTRPRTEIMAGITTFLAMAYILFVNPSILTSGFVYSMSLATGMPISDISNNYPTLIEQVKLSFTVATALAAGVATLIMSLYARLPFALAPGMGENAFIAFTVIPTFTKILAKSSWSSSINIPMFSIYLALISVLFNGILFMIFSIGKIRELIINSVPESIKFGIAIGIGLFISTIGLSNIGLIAPGNGLVTINWNSFLSLPLYIGFLTILIATVLNKYKISGSYLIAIFVATGIGIAFKLVSVPSNILLPPAFSTSILNNLPMSFYIYFTLFGVGFPIAFSLFLVDFFDGVGTITGLASKAGLIKNGKVININKALISDSLASILAPFFGTSTTVVYIESAAGIESGGKSGLTSFITGILFLISIPLAPLFLIVPSFATGGILVIVGLSFLTLFRNLIQIIDPLETIPAYLTILGIPLTFSITAGIGIGIITYVLLKLFAGKFSEINLRIILIALLFALYFALTTFLETH